MIASDLAARRRLRRAAVRRLARGDRRARRRERASATRSIGRRSTPRLPNLLEDDELERGNALFQTVENIAWAAGPLIGGAIVAAPGTHAAYWINAVSFVFSALAHPADPGAPPAVGERRSAGALARHRRRASRSLRTSPALKVVRHRVERRRCSAVACVNVGEVVIAKDSFNAGDFGFGLLFGASGVGLAIGSFAGGDARGAAPDRSLYGPAIDPRGVGYAARRGRAERLGRGGARSSVGGIGNGAAALYNVLLIQRGVPDRTSAARSRSR